MINAPSVNRQTDDAGKPFWTSRVVNGVIHMADQKTTLQARQAVQMQKAKLILDTAEREGRGLTAEENKELKALEAAVDGMAQRLANMEGDENMNAEIARLTAGMDGTVAAGERGGRRAAGKGSLGAQFATSDVMTWLKDSRNNRAGAWSSPSTELTAATLTEDPASAGGLVVTDTQAGILPSVTRPLVVADLLLPGSTGSNSVTFLQETAFTNAAAAVAEGGTKPESALVFTPVTEPVKKIAHFLPVTDELLTDAPGMQSYIDGRLRLGVQLTEDDNLLNGSGVGPILLGLRMRAGLAPDVVRGTDTNADAIAKQIAAIAAATNLAPDGIIMHPSNWLAIQLAKTPDGVYYGDGPFAAPARPMLWGLPVALTTAITLGVALVGAFKAAAQVFRNGQLRVDVSNSHADFFIKNLVAIRAEERLALVTYRNAAIGEVTGLE